jgi:hypothetical protein
MTSEELRAALKRAYRLGQDYRAQASDYTSHCKKAEVTQDTFEQFVEDMVSAFEEQA